MSQDPPSNWDSVRQEIYQRDDYHCQNCGSRGGPDSEIELHVHHAVPLSHGGLNNTANLRTLCKRCHTAAHTRRPAATGVERGRSIDRQAVEQAGIAIGDCEVCGSDDFGYETNDMISCMNCDWVYQLEKPYISDAVTETFKTCPRWFCNSSEMEYTPFYFNQGKSGRVRCNGCGKTWRVDPQTGASERYTPYKPKRDDLTIRSEWRTGHGNRELRDGLLDVWHNLRSGRS